MLLSDNPSNGEGSVLLGDVKVWQDDYSVDKKTATKHCDFVNPEGKTAVAYYKKRKGNPDMHYCYKFFTRKGKEEFLKNACASIANHIDTATTTRQYRGANIHHEFMHYPRVGQQQYVQPVRIKDFCFETSTYKT